MRTATCTIDSETETDGSCQTFWWFAKLMYPKIPIHLPQKFRVPI